MEADFVNVFIEKQREVISDLTSKNVMAEARLAFAEQKLQRVQDVIDELDANKEHVVQLMQQLEQLNEEKIKFARDANQHASENQQLKEQLHLAEQYLNQKTFDNDELKDLVKKLNIEKEVYEAKAIRLKNKAKQIAEE